MNRQTLLFLLICLSISQVSFAGLVTHSLTSETNDTSAPDLASCPWGESMLVYTVSEDSLLMDLVRVIAFPTSFGCMWGWDDPVTLGSGSLGKVCWGRTQFHAAVVSGPVVLLRHTDQYGDWDLTDEVLLTPNGEIINIDIWGDPSTVGEGADAFLVVETMSNPPGGEYHVEFASHDANGWSELETVVSVSEIRPFPQVSWYDWHGGPLPMIFYHSGQPGASQLRTVIRNDNGVWYESNYPFPEPFVVAGEFDVLSRENNKRHILGLGMQPTCPCGTVHHRAFQPGVGWQSAENMTVGYADYDWPKSPRLANDSDGTIHAFWYQEATGDDFTPLGKTLEYYVWVSGDWVDNSNILNEPGTRGGIGSELAIAVEPASRPVLAWTQRDTLEGVPQPRQIYIARYFSSLYQTPVRPVPDPVFQLTAWPNPFNPRVEIAFEVGETREVRLDIFDARGMQVARLFDQVVTSGRAVVSWNGTDDAGRQVSSGVYFAQAVSGGKRSITKLVLAE